MNANTPQLDTSQSLLEPGPSARKLRTALLLAFGGLLILMLLAGVDALVRLHQLHAIEQQVSNRFLNHTRALSAVVVSVHLYHDQLTKYFLEDQSANPDEKDGEITNQAAQAHYALRSYPSDRGPQEQELLTEIERELFEQERASSTLLTLAPQDRRVRSRRLIQEEILPRSLTILQVSQQMASLNSELLVRENQDLLSKFASLQMRLRSMLLVALSAGLLLSLVGSFYILRLEQQGRARYQALADSRLELEKLSARLVDAQERERRTIARELHDEVGQTLETLLMSLGGLLRRIPAEELTTREQINQVKTLAENSVKNVRDIALLLRPSMLDDLGLIPALEWQAREVSRRSQMEVEVHSDMDSEDLPDEVKICVYRLVQEALNNAAAHASARSARVSVARTADRVRIEITDDGQGFDARRARGLGLLGMEERVKGLGGVLQIDSRAGRGTSLIAELPLPLVKSA